MKIHLCPSHELKCLASALSSHYVQPMLKFLQKGPKDLCRDGVKGGEGRIRGVGSGSSKMVASGRNKRKSR